MGKGESPGGGKASGGGAEARAAFFMNKYSQQNTLHVIQKVVRDIIIRWNDKETSAKDLEFRLDKIMALDVEKSEPDIDFPQMILKLWEDPRSCFSKLDEGVSKQDIRLLVKKIAIDSLTQDTSLDNTQDDSTESVRRNYP